MASNFLSHDHERFPIYKALKLSSAASYKSELDGCYYLKTDRKCQRHACVRQRFKHKRTIKNSLTSMLALPQAMAKATFLEGIDMEGPLVVAHEERAIELTGATAKSGKSVV